jgi:hypothetical protein
MAPTVHAISPDYDTVLILKGSSTKFAGIEAPGLQSTEDSPIHYHVSSQHLQLASPWFKRAMTNETWAESKSVDGHYHIIAHDWDSNALLVLLNILHLRNRQVPGVISLEFLAKMAVLVDYYECSEAIEPFTSIWTGNMKNIVVPSAFCRDVVLWICVAWIFAIPERFQAACAVAIKEGKDNMDTLGLPIPPCVLGLFFILND